jgi:hypothetical protein
MSESGNANPIEALFGADNPGVTSPGNRPYLKSVTDPISQPYGVTDGTLLGGMSSKGASRWSFGHTSSKGAVGTTHPNYPHDVDGNGDFWSVKYDAASRILTHYYTGVHIRDNTAAVASPGDRWTPLQISWAGVCPALMLHGQNCAASVQVQNTGVSDWNCSSASYSLRYRWVKSGFPETPGSAQASLCGLAKGNAVTVNLNINDLPNWGAGAYTLKLDVARIQAGQTFWFSNGGWPSFDVGLCVDGPCKTFVPHIVK